MSIWKHNFEMVKKRFFLVHIVLLPYLKQSLDDAVIKCKFR